MLIISKLSRINSDNSQLKWDKYHGDLA